MPYTSVFGQDLTDYEIEILTDNGVGEALWATAAHDLNRMQQWHGGAFRRTSIYKALKSIGLAGGAIGTLAHALHRRATTTKRFEGTEHVKKTTTDIKAPRLRGGGKDKYSERRYRLGTSFLNLLCHHHRLSSLRIIRIVDIREFPWNIHDG